MNIRHFSFTQESLAEAYKGTLLEQYLEHGAVGSPSDCSFTFDVDKPRTSVLLGTHKDDFLKPWEEKKHSMRYTQGDIEGSSSGNMLWDLASPAAGAERKTIMTEKDEEFFKAETLSFGYVDKDKKKCGLFIKYLKNDPTHWVVCVHRDFDQEDAVKRKIEFFCSQDIFAPPQVTQDAITHTQAVKEILEAINLPTVGNTLRSIITSKGIDRRSVKSLQGKTSDIIVKLLPNYIDIRTEEKNKEWLGFFSTATIKIGAARKLIRILTDDSNTELFNSKELEALHDGRLGKLIEPCISFLPNRIQEQFTKYHAHTFAQRMRP